MTDNIISDNPQTQEVKQTTFAELGLSEAILNAVNDIGFQYATPIQTASIPALLAGKDLLGLAQTGSGKTASFMLPLLSNLDKNEYGIQILVLSPTRELAVQVAKATEDFCKYMPNVKPLAIYGGQPYGGQIASLRKGANIIIATPGRLIDHLDKGTINLSNLKAIVLDEADEMLSMGFADDLTRILEAVPETVQTALFSATMPKTIEGLTKKYLKDPTVVKIDNSIKKNQPKIDQYYWLVQNYSRNQALLRFLEVESYDAAIIFCKTRQGANEVTEFLLKNNHAAACLHGDISQEIRESTLNGLRNESINILVATDVAARGLDIDRINLVVNYELPADNENYVHRVGRTGRAGREGRAISFVAENDRATLYAIEKLVHRELKEIFVPSNEELENHRRAEFKRNLEMKLNDHTLERYASLVESLIPNDYSTSQVIAALVNLATTNCRLVLPKSKEPKQPKFTYDREYYANARNRGRFGAKFGRQDNNSRFANGRYGNNSAFNTYFISVGRNHGVDVPTLIRTISSVASNVRIGQISLRPEHSIVELPKNFGEDALAKLKAKQINGMKLQVREWQVRAPRSDKPRSYNDGQGRDYREQRNFDGQHQRFERPYRQDRQEQGNRSSRDGFKGNRDNRSQDRKPRRKNW